MSDSSGQPWVVMKFGGTSVAGADQWRAIAALVAERRAEGVRVLVVCSALAGVTDQLLALAAGEVDDDSGLSGLRDLHARLAVELGVDPSPWLDAGLETLATALASVSGPRRTAAIVAQGEWFSSQLGAAFLDGPGARAAWVDAREALSVAPEPDPESARAWLVARCDVAGDPALESRWRALDAVLVTQGYVVRGPDGGSALLGRGGSDTSAALMGACLGAARVEIWTDVPGLFTADPRHEPGARLIPELAWEEALEMAAGGARVIHGRSIRASAEAGVPLWIRDLSNPSGQGTRIVADPAPAAAGARAVACQPHMLVLLLQNLDTRQQVGFLAGVFRVISDRGLSVDQVATSETTTTLAIDTRANHLEPEGVAELVAALQPLCSVEAFPGCVGVNLVGRDARLALHGLAGTRAFFQEHRLLMMSHSAADRCVSLLVEAEGAAALARLLHSTLVLGGAPARD